jgi:acetyl-CoA carboxylase biotin carboxylase subunit
MKKILIANRGEIAVRIIHACREMEIPACVVYSEADRESLHVHLADEAVCIGPPSPLESYLNVDAVVAAAKETGCDAVHPGYGFLAENASFSERCTAEGLTFIGPSAEAIRSMGDKVKSRKMMKAAGVPVVPGTTGGIDDFDRILEDAAGIPLPLFVKAAAGGGGKGMRLVTDRDTLKATLESATREAASAFGDGTVYVEKCVEQPRHIEFQVLADNAGNTVHLFERECSIQRRHQKLVEETPAGVLTPKIRAKMGKAAVDAARAVDYRGAGTVEFLFDRDGSFYFLEMNTRIQVEHPVTEFTTGVDLVKWQIRIAGGEDIGFRQEDLRQRGHSIECRIYAEDAENNFMPSSGRITYLKEPWGPGVRNDSGIYPGCEVSTFYDPILAKLVVYDENRELARKKMLTALENYVILGIRTSISYLRDLLSHEAFIEGDTYTDFIPKHMADWKDEAEAPPDDVLLAAAIAESFRKPTVAVGGEIAAPTPWQTTGSWEVGREG